MKRRGYLIAEAVIAMSLIGVLIVAMAVMVTRQQKAAAALAEQRELARAAEQALLSLRSAEAPMPAGVEVRVEPVEGGETIAGRTWVRLTVAREGREVSLIGLARPDRAAEARGGAR